MQAMHGRLSDPGQLSSAAALHHAFAVGRGARVDATARRWCRSARASWRSMTRASPNRARQSVGVQRQYCGALGKIGNCQVAVSSALIADGRTWPLAFELYLPGVVDRRRRAPRGRRAFRRRCAFARSGASRWPRCGPCCRPASRSPASWSMPTTGANAAFRAGLERLGLRYGVAIRGEATFTVPGVDGAPLSATALGTVRRPTTRGRR